MRAPAPVLATLLTCLFLHVPFLPAQQYTFRGYSVQDGLPQSSVFSMLQDSRGYLWLGTLGGGVARFDGESFESWDISTGLAGNVVRCIFEDHKGQLWFGTDQGISLYDGYRLYTIGKEEGLLGEQVLSLAETDGGQVWAGTEMGLNRLVTGGDSIRISQFGSSQGLRTGLIFDIKEDRWGRLWLATYQDGIQVLSISGNEITAQETIGAGLLPSNSILDLEKDPEGNFWVATGNAGICHILVPPGGGAYQVERLDRDQGLLDPTVYDLELDHLGQLWIATGAGGLHKWNGRTMEYYGEKQGAPSNQILAVIEDRNHKIWAGSNDNGFFGLLGDYFTHFTESGSLSHDVVTGIVQVRPDLFYISTFGGGLNEISLTGGDYRIRTLGREEGLPDLFVNGLSLAPDGVLWIATNDRGVVSYDGRSFRQMTVYNGLISNHVNSILADSNGDIWCGTSTGICRYNGDGFFCISEEDEFGLINNTVNTILEDREGNVWAGTMGGLVRFTGSSMTDYNEEEGLAFKKINTLCEGPDGRIWIGTFGGGLYVYDPALEGEESISPFLGREELGSANISSLVFLNDTVLLVGMDKGVDKVFLSGKGEPARVRNYDQSDGFTGMENNNNAICRDNLGRVWFGTVHGLTLYDPSREEAGMISPKPRLTEVRLLYEKVNWEDRGYKLRAWFNVPESLSLPFSDNHLTFVFRSVSLSNPEKVRYRHRLLYNDTIWSPPRTENQVTYSGLNPGEYVLEVSSMNEEGIWSPAPLRYAFVIKPPFYQTWWFILSMAFLTLLAIFLYIKWRERKLVIEKRELEEKVNERTLEIRKQKNEIEEKNRTLEEAYLQISSQKTEIEQKNLDITASIEYARRIQSAMLPSGRVLKENLDGHFIFYRPKDIVSGDFYWFRKTGNALMIVAADCTGHGVPGAFMSMLGISFLDEIVDKESLTDPAAILDRLRENIILSLKQSAEESDSKDGMDMAICHLDLETRELRYAGANNSLYLVEQGRLQEIPADRMPVAIHDRMEPFTLHTRQLKPGTCLYLFSDGFADQFGGPEGKKFKYKTFRDTLVALSDKSMREQLEKIEQVFDDWIGGKKSGGPSYEQIDDILLMGCRIS